MNDWRRTRRMVKGSNGNVAWIDTLAQADKDRERRQQSWQAVFDALPPERKEAFNRLSRDEQERFYRMTAAEFAEAIQDLGPGGKS